ncbi:MAG: GTP 3',8-cyclase MoaA [Ketobacteraceae bacterium]|nr:GTP 3',8-cyclase MoaA [Ketobacteraceae bacterium]
MKPRQAGKSKPGVLTDSFGRTIDYVRISLTDRCNFRCLYCMSEDMTFLPRQQVLSLEEVFILSRALTELGVKKIRLTGGEPLVRQGAVDLMARLSALPGLQELVLTTNGSLLEEQAGDLKHAGVRRINISIDSLRRDRFREMTRTGELSQVLAGIDSACRQGFERIKLNAVILQGRNDDEVIDLLEFALERGIDISFIEEMPLGQITSHNRASSYFSSEDVVDRISQRYKLIETPEKTAGPSRYFRIPGFPDSRIGLISPHSHNFCASCNRVRVTAEGRLLLCLGNEHSVDLKRVIRCHPAEPEILKRAILEAVQHKPYSHEFDLNQTQIVRFMNTTGG